MQSKVIEEIDEDRRMLLGAAALGIAAVGVTSLLPSPLAAAPTPDAIDRKSVV